MKCSAGGHLSEHRVWDSMFLAPPSAKRQAPFSILFIFTFSIFLFSSCQFNSDLLPRRRARLADICGHLCWATVKRTYQGIVSIVTLSRDRANDALSVCQ